MQTEPQRVAKQIAEGLAYGASRQPGAILLNGGWGVGKTHLWINEINPLLGDCPKAYVSLFGIKSADEMNAKIASAFFSAAGEEGAPWKEKFFKSLPGVLLKGVEGLAKNYLGNEGAEIIKALNLKIDPLTLIPSGTVICIDDLERSKMDIEEALGAINFLLEHKAARILIIANQDYLRDDPSVNEKTKETYKKFKEKVVWKTVGFNTPMEHVIEDFISTYASSNKDKIRNLNPLVLKTLESGGCVNLRTLQKVVRLLDETLNVPKATLEECHLRFLIALIIEDDQKGLLPKSEIYAGNFYFSALSKNKVDPDELKGDEKVSHNFYFRYFDGQIKTGAVTALHKLVRTGVLDEELLIAETEPDDAKLDPGAKLSKSFADGEWFYWLDQPIKELADKIEQFLRIDGKTSSHGLIRLFGAVVRLQDQIGGVVPGDLLARTGERIRTAVQTEKEDLRRWPFEYSSKEEEQILSPLIAICVEEREKARLSEVKSEIVGALKNGEYPDVLSPKYECVPFLLSLLADKEILDLVDGLVEKAPRIHFAYYKYLYKRIQADKDHEKLKPELAVRLKTLRGMQKNISTQKRLVWLVDGFSVKEVQN